MKIKKYFHITLGTIITLSVLVAFYLIYGASMFFRYVLGGLMFATFTVWLIVIVKKYGKQKVF